MRNGLEPAMTEVLAAASGPAGFCVGWIVRMDVDGRPFVDFPGNRGEPVEARHIVATLPAGFTVTTAPSVLLAFERGDLSRPIVLGFIGDSLTSTARRTETFMREKEWSVRLDRKSVVFDAENEIVLRCGKSSVTLRKDGTIVLKGVDIVSRAIQTNKIKGANVMIN